MPITLYCFKCGHKNRAPDNAAGKQGRCSRCNEPVRIPATDQPPPSVAGSAYATATPVTAQEAAAELVLIIDGPSVKAALPPAPVIAASAPPVSILPRAGSKNAIPQKKPLQQRKAASVIIPILLYALGGLGIVGMYFFGRADERKHQEQKAQGRSEPGTDSAPDLARSGSSSQAGAATTSSAGISKTTLMTGDWVTLKYSDSTQERQVTLAVIEKSKTTISVKIIVQRTDLTGEKPEISFFEEPADTWMEKQSRLLKSFYPSESFDWGSNPVVTHSVGKLKAGSTELDVQFTEYAVKNRSLSLAMRLGECAEVPLWPIVFSEVRAATGQIVTLKLIDIGYRNFNDPYPNIKPAPSEAHSNPIATDVINTNHAWAIKACNTYMNAQDLYHHTDWDKDGILEYAQSIQGDHSLYELTAGEGNLTLVNGAFANAAFAEVGPKKAKPMAGYFFKILKGQGANSPGGQKSYLVNGNMTLGYALVAWPAEYGKTGIETYIISKVGTIYKRDLGVDTAKIAASMLDYDPGDDWENAEL